MQPRGGLAEYESCEPVEDRAEQSDDRPEEKPDEVRDRKDDPEQNGQAAPREIVVDFECHGVRVHSGIHRISVRLSPMAIDKETAERIEQPVDAEAEHEARLTPAEAVARMKINVPVRGNRKLRTLVERVNADDQVKGWWHVSNVNAVARMAINDHSWVHVQIVTNIALKLLRQLTKHGVEPGLVRDFGLEQDDAEIVVVLAALFHCIGMSIHRHGHEDFTSSSPSRRCGSCSTASTTSPTRP